MTAPRLIAITRRFWPLTGGAETVMASLATGFAERGWRVDLLTAQWEPAWPERIDYQGVRVARIFHPQRWVWGTLRYMRGLGKWLHERRNEIDAVLVSMHKHDAYAALGALRKTGVPIAVRAEGAGATGDCRWHETGNFGRIIRRRCRTATAFIAPSDAIARELRAAGYAENRIERIDNGVAAIAEQTPELRAAAREALTDWSSDLSFSSNVPVVAYTGRMHLQKGLSDLIAAWRTIVRRWPQALLLLVGEGPDAAELYREVIDRDLTDNVLMLGAFDQVTDFLHAADAFVLPSYQEGTSLALLEAMSARVPVVATDIEGNRPLITHEEHGLLVPPRNPAALAAALEKILEDRPLAERLAANARLRVQQEFSREAMLDKHQALLERLMGK